MTESTLPPVKAKRAPNARNIERSEAARKVFLTWIGDNGYTLKDGFEWRGALATYEAICAQGHACKPRPSVIQRGSMGCRTCGRVKAGAAKSAGARDRFLTWIRDNGFTLEEPFEWAGAFRGYPATCPNGHPCRPNPNSVQQGQGGCARCSRRRVGKSISLGARDRFLAWISDNGYTLADSFEWAGTTQTYDATCPEGHACKPSPNHVRQGVGGCHACAGKRWDAFYVVQHPQSCVIKFGVTSGDPRPRLKDHARNGFTEELIVYRNLEGRDAADLEQELMKLLRLAGVEPVQGREYFPAGTASVILAVSDDWLIR